MQLSRGSAHVLVAAAVALIAVVATAIRVSPLSSRSQTVAALPPPPAPGDTAVIHGPRRYDAPIGSSNTIQNFVDTIPVSMNPYHRYVIRVKNGNPDGTQRVLRALVAGTDSILGTMAQKAFEIAVKPTTLITVAIRGQASAGHLTIELLEINGGNFAIFGTERFSRRNTNSDVVFTRTFTRGANAGPPFFLWIINGTASAGQRIAGVIVKLNGDTVVGPAPRFPSLPASTFMLMVKVSPVSGSNTLVIILPRKEAGYIDLTILATDNTAPTLTITAPAPNKITRFDTVHVQGSVADASPVTVTIDGQEPSTMSGDSFHIVLQYPPGADGLKVITISAVDAAGNRTDSTRSVTVDRTPPSFAVLTPQFGFITNQTSITVSGTASDNLTGVTVYVNDDAVPVSGGGFSRSVPLVEGTNTITVTAIDGAGNAGPIEILMGTRDTQRPTLTVSAPADGATVSAPTVTVQGTASDAMLKDVKVNGVATTVSNGAFSKDVDLVVGQNTIVVIATDSATNADTVTRTVTRATGLPPDPATVATAIDPTIATTVYASTAFLYSGANPIQTGVSAGTIETLRAAVLRGRVLDRNGQALSGIRIEILDHPEYGHTLSRADGRFDLAVNGGGALTVTYTGTGVLEVQRSVEVPWQDFVPVDDVTMVALDPQVTTVDFSAPVEVARGSPVTDVDGTRRATLLFKQGTQATLVMPDGSEQPLSSINVRATEYTVGSSGPQAMPAPLPPASAYTYAVELSADTAIALGAKEVRFDQPIPFYLENFLGFPVGMAMPMGFYDRSRAAWMPSQNGRVVKIVSMTGGLADLDITGDGVADDATSLGVDDAERGRLAALYSAGQELWRVPVTHFSPWDANSPAQLPPGSGVPNPEPIQAGGAGGGGGGEPGDKKNAKKSKDDACKRPGGSVIECENQTLGEMISVVGTQFTLNYRDDRVPGHGASRELVIPLIGDTVPDGLAVIRLRVHVAGQVFEDSFPPTPNQQTNFTWDGKDAYGRNVIGIQPVTVLIAYEYESVYRQPAAGDTSFGRAGGAIIPDVNTRDLYTSTTAQKTTLGGWDARAQGLGGWTLSVHHAYDPIGGVLYLGDGSKRSALTLGQSIVTVAGNGTAAFAGDSGPATRASLSAVAVLAAPDGSFYLSDQSNLRIRKVSPDGTILTVAGNGVFGSGPDSGLATETPVNLSYGLALGPDGALYIAEWNASKIRRVGLDGIITTVAGNGNFGFSGDGGPATDAAINAPVGLAFGPDGSLYFSDAQNNRIRRISPDGIITTVAGNGTAGYGGDSGLAVDAMLNFPQGIAVSPQGEVFIADFRNARVRRISSDGIITTVAGNGDFGFAGDGGPATGALLGLPRSVSIGADGMLYINDNPRVRVVTPSGIIRTVAGSGARAFGGDGGPPTGAGIDPGWVSIGANGLLYIADPRNNRVRAIKPTLPALGVADILVASGDRSEFYRFSPEGRHLSTIDALTGSVRYQFAYTPAGLLASVTDVDGNVTAIERAQDGLPAAITGPYGARTPLDVGTTGFLDRVTDPAGQIVGLHYAAGGLLDTLTTPRGYLHRFTHDSVGRLTRDQGPSGEDMTITRRDSASITEVRVSTAEGRSTAYRLESSASGQLLRTVTDLSGVTAQERVARNDSVVFTSADGTVSTMVLAADPRAGFAAPALRSIVTRTPSGLTSVTTASRTITRPDSSNPLSLTTVVDSLSLNGRWTVRSYSAATRQLTMTSAAGRQRFMTLDAKGRIAAARVASLDSARFTYDSRGRISQLQVGGRGFVYGYDSRGRLSNVLDPIGRRDSLFYDNADRLIRRVLPDGRAILLGYDSSGNVTSVTPPARPQHGFQFTPSGLTQEYDPPGIPGPKPTRYVYNRDRQIDSIVRPDSVSLRFAYDLAGRPTSLTFDRGTSTFRYSPTTGKLIGIRSPTGDSVTFTYDGSLATQVRWTGVVNGSVGAAHDNNFRVTSQTVNGANAVSFEYDQDGLLLRAGALRLGHRATDALLTADTLGPVVSTFGYSSRGELAGHRVISNGSTIFAAGYVRDSLGRIAQLFDTTQGTPTQWSFVYDSIGRIVADSVNGAIFHAFAYDGNGNRVSFTSTAGNVGYTYDNQDRLLSAGTTTFAYGSNGELKTRTVPGVGTTSYTYDALGNLVTVLLPSGARIDYVIDGQNRRIGRKMNGTLIQGWLYQNQLNPVAETDANGNVVARYVYGSRMNVPDYMIKSGVMYRLISDRLGSVRLVADTTGVVVQRIDYDEWGNIVLNTNPGFQPFGFAGGLLDDSTRLVRFGARDYDPSVGRWTAKDPIRFGAGESNLYAYADNDPVNSFDPTGRQTLQVGVSVSGTLFGVGFTFSATVGIDIHGNLGVLYTGGLGDGLGADLQGGITVQTSNAATICRLTGVFGNGSVGAGEGLGAAVDVFTGNSPEGVIVGGGVTVGAGLGAGGFVGPTETVMPGPVLHLW